MSVWAMRINTAVFALALVLSAFAPMPVWWTPVVATLAGVYAVQVARTPRRRPEAVEAVEPVAEIARRDGRLDSGQPGTALAPGFAHACSTPGCTCRGEVRDWCQGCGRTPVSWLMGWTEGGLYRCRDCRTNRVDNADAVG